MNPTLTSVLTQQLVFSRNALSRTIKLLWTQSYIFQCPPHCCSPRDFTTVQHSHDLLICAKCLQATMLVTCASGQRHNPRCPDCTLGWEPPQTH